MVTTDIDPQINIYISRRRQEYVARLQYRDAGGNVWQMVHSADSPDAARKKLARAALDGGSVRRMPVPTQSIGGPSRTPVRIPRQHVMGLFE